MFIETKDFVSSQCVGVHDMWCDKVKLLYLARKLEYCTVKFGSISPTSKKFTVSKTGNF